MKKTVKFLLVIILININVMSANSSKIAILGGGCFWCLEAIFQKVRGVEKVESGYSGGNVKNPTYQEVCTGQTNHAEVVKITFNPEVISYKTLLSIFFAIHDPTSLNRQGGDVGTQYRSVIFYNNEDQKKIAENYMQQLKVENIFDKELVTQLVKEEPFYKAEDLHQNYYELNHQQPYCQAVINPKLNKFRSSFKQLLVK